MTNVLYICFDKRINEETRKTLVKWYSEGQGFKSDSGLNLYFPQDIEFQVNCNHKVGFGINCMMECNGSPTAFTLMARSSIWKYPLIMCNSVGLIDESYRGEIAGTFYCHPDTNAMFDNGQIVPKETKQKLIEGKITIPAGDSLVQIVAPNLKSITIKFVDTLPDTARGSAGFGSTGTGFGHSNAGFNSYSSFNERM